MSKRRLIRVYYKSPGLALRVEAKFYKREPWSDLSKAGARFIIIEAKCKERRQGCFYVVFLAL